jgi:hypothetical protein
MIAMMILMRRKKKKNQRLKNESLQLRRKYGHPSRRSLKMEIVSIP